MDRAIWSLSEGVDPAFPQCREIFVSGRMSKRRCPLRDKRGQQVGPIIMDEVKNALPRPCKGIVGRMMIEADAVAAVIVDHGEQHGIGPGLECRFRWMWANADMEMLEAKIAKHSIRK